MRGEEVIAHQLDPGTEPLGELAPAHPVGFPERVLERHDRIALAQVGPAIDELAGGQRATVAVQR